MRIQELRDALIKLCSEGYGLADVDVAKLAVFPSEDHRRWNDEVAFIRHGEEEETKKERDALKAMRQNLFDLYASSFIRDGVDSQQAARVLNDVHATGSEILEAFIDLNRKMTIKQ